MLAEIGLSGFGMFVIAFVVFNVVVIKRKLQASD